MTGTTAQPSHKPSQERKGTGTRHTEKHQWRRKQQSLGGGGGERKWLKEPSTKENWTRQWITWSMKPAAGHAQAKDRWPQALKALLVVNSFKLHLHVLEQRIYFTVYINSEKCIVLIFTCFQTLSRKRGFLHDTGFPPISLVCLTISLALSVFIDRRIYFLYSMYALRRVWIHETKGLDSREVTLLPKCQHVIKMIAENKLHCLVSNRGGLGTSRVITGLTRRDPYSQKEHTEISNILKFGVYRGLYWTRYDHWKTPKFTKKYLERPDDNVAYFQ